MLTARPVASTAGSDGNQHTLDPIVTGASVLGVKYTGGVMLMADTLGSYGSLARFCDVERIRQVNDTTIVACSGEYSDLQYIDDLLHTLVVEDYAEDDGASLNPEEIFHYLSRVMYNRRSKVNPLWNQAIVAGFADGKPFLGYTDLYGSTFEDNLLATGFGQYLAMPLMRKAIDENEGKMSADEAKALLEESMRVLFYRDGRTINKFQTANITAEGVEISKPYSLDTQWKFKKFVHPTETR
jgi:20S proteasome subunit beta 7